MEELKRPDRAKPKRPVSAEEKASAILAQRPHFKRELAEKLGRSGFASDEIAAALGRLERAGFLDDRERTRAFARELAERRGYGRARIARELERRGAPASEIAAVLGAVDESDELERARAAAARWRRRGTGDAASLARHLARRGFAARAIFSVLKDAGLDAAAVDRSDD